MDSGLTKRIQELAVELSARGTRPGHVGAGTRRRAGAINRELVAMFNTELDQHTTTEFQRYKKDENGNIVHEEKTGEGKDDKPYQVAVLEPDHDREPVTWGIPNAKGEILKAMIQHLVSAAFGKPAFSAIDHEAAILKAVQALPELCDKLQALPVPSSNKNEGTTKGNPSSRQRRMSINVANETLKGLLETDPEKYLDMGQVKLASEVGCSRGTLGKTSAYRIEMPKLRRKRR